MQKWAQGLRQWSLWLVGEGSTPDRSAGLMLGATVAVVALLGAGAAFALKSPSPSKATGARSADAALYKAALAQKKAARHQTTATTQPKKKKKTSKTVITRRERAAEYEKALSLAMSEKSHHRAKRTGTKVRVKHTHHHVNTGAYKQSTEASAAPSSPPVDALSATAAPDIASTLLDPVSLAPSPSAPAAPTIIGTVSGSAGTRVTWSAPTEGGSSPVSGYNLYMGVSPGAQYTTPVNGSQLISGRSFVVNHVIAGTTYSFTVRAINAVGISAPSNQVSTIPPVNYQAVGTLAAPVVAMASNRWGTGYWLANSAGAVSPHGSVPDYGSMANVQLNAPIIQIVSTANGRGYWEVASDGGVFAYGDAGYYGSMGGHPLNAPIVGFATTTNGRGYWEVASDGGVFAFGDARFGGSMAGRSLDQPIVGIALDRGTGGYWEVASNGDVFAFGGAPNLGSPSPSAVNDTVIGIAGAPAGHGYWEVTSDGGVYPYGSAPFHGSVTGQVLNAPIGGMAVDEATGGYWLYSLDGGTFAFRAPFYGAG